MSRDYDDNYDIVNAFIGKVKEFSPNKDDIDILLKAADQAQYALDKLHTDLSSLIEGSL